jgi:hypothetical protein
MECGGFGHRFKLFKLVAPATWVQTKEVHEARPLQKMSSHKAAAEAAALQKIMRL